MLTDIKEVKKVNLLADITHTGHMRWGDEGNSSDSHKVMPATSPAYLVA